MRTRHVVLAAAIAGALPVGEIPSMTAQENASLTSAQLAEHSLHRRAVEAVIWGMPAVNYERMLQAALEKQLPIAKRLGKIASDADLLE